MARILVPPDVILRVSEQFNRAAEQLEYVKETLSRQIHMLTHSWDGTTKERFYEDFYHARHEMGLTIERQRFVSKELQEIAFRFITADSQNAWMNPDKFAELLVKMPPPAPEPKTWEDHVEDFLQGVKAGGIALADSLVDTGKALYEDPIGTGGDMLYNATIGTAEEIIDTSVWGTRMIFDIGDTRAEFDEKIESAGGFSNLAGQQTAMIVGGAMLRRVGVKGSKPGVKHGPTVDAHKRSEEMGKVQTGGREMSLKEYARQEAEASKLYDIIRASTSDVQAISKNTGMSESRVQRIKDHVFNKEHIKSSGNGRFDPDYEIAQAWQRLQDGTHTPKDIELLNHEIFESKFEGIYKTNYETAHSASEKSGRIWRP